MRSKLFGRLMSFTLSATVALTSGIPALAYDGGGGDLPEEDVELLEEEVIEEDLEETGADFDALEDDIVEDIEAAEEEELSDDYEFESTQDVTVGFLNGRSSSHLCFYDPQRTNAEIYADTAELDGDADPYATPVSWDSSKDYFEFYVKPVNGYTLDTDSVSNHDKLVGITLEYDEYTVANTTTEHRTKAAVKDDDYSIEYEDVNSSNKTAGSARVKIFKAYLTDCAAAFKNVGTGVGQVKAGTIELTVTPVSGVAIADSYFIKVVNIDMAATNEELEVTYGSDAKGLLNFSTGTVTGTPITIIDNKDHPITNITLYTNYDPSKPEYQWGALKERVYEDYENDSLDGYYGDYYFDKAANKYGSAKKLYVFKSAIEAGYKGKLTAVAESDSFAISQAAGNAASSGITLKFAEDSDAATSTSAYDTMGFEFGDNSTALYVVPTATVEGRTALAIDYTISYADGTKKTVTNYGELPSQRGAGALATSAKILSSEFVNDEGKHATSVTVSVSKTSETVAWTATAASDYSINGSPVTSLKVDTDDEVTDFFTAAETGKDYKFKIAAKAGYKIDSVKYQLAGSATKETVTVNEAGIGIVPASAVKSGTIRMYVTISENGTNVAVSATLATGSSGDLGSALGKDCYLADKNTGAVIGSSAASLAVKTEDYYFTANLAPAYETHPGYVIKDVKYTVGGAPESEAVAAVKVSGFDNLYKIPKEAFADESAITLYVATTKLVTISVPNNDAVSMIVDGEVKKANFRWEAGKPLTYTISKKATYNAEVTIDQVKTVVANGGETNIASPKSSSFTGTINAEALADNVTVYVKTTEKPNDFTLSFDGTNDTSSAPYSIDPESFNAKAGMLKIEKVNGKFQIVKPYQFLVNQTMTAYAVPQITVTRENGITKEGIDPDDSGVIFTYEQASGLLGDNRVILIDKTPTEVDSIPDGVIKVTGKKQGTETIKIKAVETVRSGEDNERKIEYTGTLAVQVTPHLVISLNGGSNVNITPDYAKLNGEGKKVLLSKNSTTTKSAIYAFIKDGATGTYLEDLSTSADYAGMQFAWSKTSSDDNFFIVSGGDIHSDYPGDGSIPKYLDTSNVGEGGVDAIGDYMDTKAFVSAEALTGTPGTFNLTITDTDNEEYTAAKDWSVTAVDNHNYMVVPTVTVAGGVEKFAFTGTLGLGVSKLNAASIGYRVYDIGTSGGSYSNQVAIDTAIENTQKKGLEPKDSGYVKEVTSSATFTSDIYTENSYSNYYGYKPELLVAPSWLTFTGSGNAYSLKATAMQKNDTAIVRYAVTINGKSFANTFEVEVFDEIAVSDVAIKLNDTQQTISSTSATPMTQKFSTDYLKKINWYSVGFDAATPDDGYLFKLVDGTAFTLPSEADLATTTYKDKTRMISSWTLTVGSDAHANVGYGNTGKSLTFDAYHQATVYPGETIIVNGPIQSLEANWADKYVVGAVSGGNIDAGVQIYRYAANITPETEEKDVDVVKIENGIATTDTSTTVGPVKTEVALLSGNATLTEGANVKLGAVVGEALRYSSGNLIYPANGSSDAQVTWFAYDDDGKEGSIADRKESGGSLNTATEAQIEAARNAQNYLDATKLASGILAPLADTDGKSFYVYPVYTKDGVKYSGEEDGVIVTIDGTAPDYTLSAKDLPTTIEVGESIATQHGETSVKLRKSSSNIGANATGTFEYIYDKTVISIEQGLDGLDKDEVIITGLKAGGKTTVNVKYTDENGVSVTSTDGIEITVASASVEVLMVDAQGNAVTGNRSAQVGTTTNDIIFTAKYTTGDKAFVQGGTWSYLSATKSGNATIASAGTTPAATGAANSNIRGLLAAAGDNVGSVDLTLNFTYTDESSKAHTYTKQVVVDTYNVVRFVATTGAPIMATGAVITQAELTEAKVSVTDGKGVEQKNSAGAYVNYELKVFEADLNSDPDADGVNQGFKIPVSGYTAKYNGTDAVVSFAGWSLDDTDGATSLDPDDEELLVYVTNNDARTDKTVTPVYPIFMDESITSINTDITSRKIVLDNADQTATALDSPEYKPTSRTVEISVSPKASAAPVTVTSTKSNSGTDTFFSMKKGAVVDSTATVEEFSFGSGDAETIVTTDTVRKYKFTIGTLDKAVGKTTLEITAAGSTAKESLELVVYGLYAKNSSNRYMTAEGIDLVDSAVTIKRNAKDVTYFFNEKGYEIIAKGPARDADGKLVLLEGSGSGSMKVVTTDGRHTNADGDGNAYITEDGVIKTGLFKTKDGKQYVATSKGILITYALTEAAGTPGRYTVDGTEYLIATDDTAEEDTLFTVAGKSWKWTKSTDGKSYISATVTFTATDGRTKEIVVPVADMKVTADGELTCYEAKASFMTKGNEVVATDTKYLDKDGNEVIPHDHVWQQDGDFVWATADSAGVRVVTLTLVCKVDAEKPHYHTLSKAVQGITKGEFTTWTASFEYEGKQYSDFKIIKNGTVSEQEVELINIGDGIAIEGLEDEYAFTNTAIKPSFQVVDASLGTYLAKGVDYTVSYKYNKKVNYSKADSKFIGDAAQVIVKGKGNYSGQAVTQTFAIYDPKEDVSEDDALLTGAKLTLPKETLVYTGEAVYPSAITLKLKGGTEVTYNHTADGDYGDIPAVVTFANNVDKGTATVFLTGKPNDKGKSTTLKKTFKIAPVNMEANAKDFTVSVDDSAWTVKGAQPDVEVVWNGDKLIKGQDFTVKYANNKKVGTAATVTVSGKGNFTKKLAAKSFEITKFNLDAAEIVATTAAEGIVANKVKATVLDKDGNAIPAKMYTVTVSEGETVLGKQKLTAGQSITVKVEAKAGATDIEGSASESIEVKANFGKAKVKVAKGFQKIYTGEKITLDDDDMKNITVTIGSGKNAKTLVYDTDFEISDEGYSNNVKKGNMTVTLVGKGDYTGFKTFKVKIAPKPMQ